MRTIYKDENQQNIMLREEGRINDIINSGQQVYYNRDRITDYTVHPIIQRIQIKRFLRNYDRSDTWPGWHYVELAPQAHWADKYEIESNRTIRSTDISTDYLNVLRKTMSGINLQHCSSAFIDIVKTMVKNEAEHMSSAREKINCYKIITDEVEYYKENKKIKDIWTKAIDKGFGLQE